MTVVFLALLSLLALALANCVGNNAMYRHIEALGARRRSAGAASPPTPPTPTPAPVNTTTTTPTTTTDTPTTSLSDTTAAPSSGVEVRYFNQTVDHFDPHNNAVFLQKYLIDWGGIDPAANHSQTLVFLIISGENLLDESVLLSNEAAALARENNAILIALEHRYYGDSVVKNLTRDGLRHLTVEQALADVSNFQASMQRSGYSGAWFAFGCSYGGVLAAWFRLKFPQQVTASLAASSPVQAIVSFYQLDQLIGDAAGVVCARALRHATTVVEQALAANFTQTLSDFGCSSITNNVDFLYVVADIVAFGIQMDSKYHFQQAMCNNFTQAPQAFLYEVYRMYASFAFDFTNTTCSDWALGSFTDTTPTRTDFMRPWLWQSCTQLGYFQTAPPSNSLRSSLITVDYHLDVCRRLFGFNHSELPDVDTVNAGYGGMSNFLGTNVVFSNGANDPWRALSVTSSLGPTVPAVVIPGQAHCANWYRPAPGDSQALERGRELVASYVGYFVDPTAICGKCKNNSTCVVATSNSDAVNVSALCTCLEGWVGDDCDKNIYVTAGLYIFIITAGCALAFSLLGVVIGRVMVLRSRPVVV